MPRGRRKKTRYTAQDENPQMSLMPEYDYQFVENAVERVCNSWEAHHAINPTEPMLLAFSGGKDSVSLYGVCKLASERMGLPFSTMFFMQYNITNVDPPELVKFVREFPEKVHIHHPKKTMWQLIVEKHLPPLSRTRYCCKELKEVSQVENGFTLTGVRHAESPRRALRGGYEILGNALKDRILINDNEGRRLTEYCMQKRAYLCNPIIDWTDEDVWHFIKKQNLPYCKLYDEGFTRLGCLGCPMASKRERGTSRGGRAMRGSISAPFRRCWIRSSTRPKREREIGASPAYLRFNSLFRWAGCIWLVDAQTCLY